MITNSDSSTTSIVEIAKDYIYNRFLLIKTVWFFVIQSDK